MFSFFLDVKSSFGLVKSVCNLFKPLFGLAFEQKLSFLSPKNLVLQSYLSNLLDLESEFEKLITSQTS